MKKKLLVIRITYIYFVFEFHEQIIYVNARSIQNVYIHTEVYIHIYIFKDNDNVLLRYIQFKNYLHNYFLMHLSKIYYLHISFKTYFIVTSK